MLPPCVAWTQPGEWLVHHHSEGPPPPASHPSPCQERCGANGGRDAASVDGDRRAAAKLVLLLDAAVAASRSRPPSAVDCASPLESLLPPKRTSPLPGGALASAMTEGGRSAVYGDDTLS